PVAGEGLVVGTPRNTGLAPGVPTGKHRAAWRPPRDSPASRYSGTRQMLTDSTLARVDKLRDWAAQRGHTVAELAIAWLLAHPEVSTVIVGARNPRQVEDNVRPVTWRLTPEERDEVMALAA